MLNIKKKIIISWTLVILWCCLIFFLSSMDTSESNSKSMKTIESTIEITNKTGITDKHLSEGKVKQVTKKLNKPLRKIAHASEYFILTILLIIAFINSDLCRKRIYLIAIIVCFLYACTDEYHQTFINGRTGQLIDVLIDISGGLISCIIMFIRNNFKKVKIG